jgi:DNA-binding FadR family transcriptional regulator
MQPRVPLYRQAQAQLKRYIATHNLGAGDPLPPESALAAEMGMSRLSLREATKSHEALGVLEARPGEGIFVKPFSFEPILDNLPYGLFVHGRSLRELFQARQGMEAGLIGMVAERIAPADLDALDALVEDMAAHARRGEPIVEPDKAFHLALFKPLDNHLVLRLIELLWEAYHRLRQEVHPEPSDPARVHRIHAGIVRALRSGDRAAVLDALERHFAVTPPGIEAPAGDARAKPVTRQKPRGTRRETAEGNRRGRPQP